MVDWKGSMQSAPEKFAEKMADSSGRQPSRLTTSKTPSLSGDVPSDSGVVL